MTLSQKEMFEHNLELTKQRLLKEIEDPEAFEWIPQNARVVNLPKDAPELLKSNLELATKLARERDEHPIVLIPEPGFEIPWQELVPVVSGRRITNIESTRGGLGFDLVFDDGSRLMLFATKRPDEKGREHPVISVGMCTKAVA